MSKGNWTQWSVELLGHFVILIGFGNENWGFQFLKLLSLGKIRGTFCSYLGRCFQTATPEKQNGSYSVKALIFSVPWSEK